MALKHTLARTLLPWINRVAGMVSLKVVSRRTPNRDFQEFFAHLKTLGMRFATVIDVGVAFGSPSLYAGNTGAKFYLVEPVPGCESDLRRLASKLGGEAFNVAAGAQDGTLDFFVHPDVSGSSSYRQIEGEFFDGKKVTVPLRRLDSLIPRPLARPALLKIDTQGAELDVLDGARELLAEIDVVIIEVSFHQFRRGAPELDEVVTRMAQVGFRAYETLEGHYRVADGALAQIDIAFVQENSPLREMKAFFTPQQAERYVTKYR